MVMMAGCTISARYTHCKLQKQSFVCGVLFGLGPGSGHCRKKGALPVFECKFCPATFHVSCTTQRQRTKITGNGGVDLGWACPQCRQDHFGGDEALMSPNEYRFSDGQQHCKLLQAVSLFRRRLAK